MTSVVAGDGSSAIAFGPAGELFLAGGRQVWRYSGGTLTLFAGNGSYGDWGNNVPATAASFKRISDIAVDGAGAVYIADIDAHRVRKVTPAGTITHFAGNGARTPGAFWPCDGTFAGDGGPATGAGLNAPGGVAADGLGNVYITDSCGTRVRRVTAAGVIGTVAGNGSSTSGGDGGPASAAGFGGAVAVETDPAGAVYVHDRSSYRVRRFTVGGTIQTVAGNGTGGRAGDGGPATSASLGHTSWFPPDNVLAVKGTGDLAFAETGESTVRAVTSGTISTVVGNGLGDYWGGANLHFSGDGGPATSAQLGSPQGIAYDSSGNMYIADTTNRRVRRVTPGGVITTFAGNGQADTTGGVGDGGPATTAALGSPTAVAIDGADNVFIADSYSSRVRKVSPGGTITTVAGSSSPCPVVGEGPGGFAGDGGPATSALLRQPTGLAVDGAGNVYVLDTGNRRIRKVTAGGIISTVAGNGSYGANGDGGPATAASIAPVGLAADAAGSLYLAEGSQVRKVAGGVITRFAGDGVGGHGGDGGPATDASLWASAIAVDPAGAVFVGGGIGPSAQTLNPPCVSTFVTSGPTVFPPPQEEAVRRISPGGVITTVAGPSVPGFGGDGGNAVAATLNSPVAVAPGPGGVVAIAHSARIRVIQPGVVPGSLGVPSATAGDGAARVSWSPPAVPGTGPLAGYVVRTYPGGAVQTVPASQTAAVVRGLGNGVAVTFTVAAVGAWGEGPESPPSAPVAPFGGGSTFGASFRPLTPYRALDTRSGRYWGAVGPGGTKSVKVAGVGAIPFTASAVVMNVTVTGGTAASYLTAFPTGGAVPSTANLLFGPGQTVPNLVTVGVGAGGRVSLFNQQGTVDVIADVVGYFDDGSSPDNGFAPIAPQRLLDSRSAAGAWSGVPLGAGVTRDVVVRGQAGVPLDATGVVMNVTVTGATAASYLQAFPSGVAQPLTANLVFGAGQTVPNLVTVGIGSNGKISLFNQKGSVHVVVDVVGYYAPSGAGRFHAIPPTRLLDSRTSTGGWPGSLGANAVRGVTVVGGTVPAGATGLVANVTVTGGTQASFLSMSPRPISQPVGTANLLFAKGQTVPNAVVVGIGTGNQTDIYNQLGNVHVILDAAGYFAP